MTCKPYPSDVSDEEWSFVALYLTLMTEDAPHRDHSLREVFNGLRWMARTGAPWRMIPNDLPPCHAGQGQDERALGHQMGALGASISIMAPARL
jgi:transposase